MIVIVNQKYRIMFNLTHSLPQKIFFIEIGNQALVKGDFLVTKSNNLPNLPHEFALIKEIAGSDSDIVTIRNNKLYINNNYCCLVKRITVKWGILHPLTESTVFIPKGCFFVRGTSDDSFDSRFKEFGFICKNQILGKAYPLF
ncbi:MAG: S26 family signal peptidase [Burkholderiales bacterium]|nr:S26 family signal peptidase [Burkholderiales bacterium]